MLSESHPTIRRIVRFLMLPHCFFCTIDWNECTKSRLQVMADLLFCFFVLKNYPDNYGPCRLWEKPRSEWSKYYGSNYNPLQRARLRATVHPFHLEQALMDKEVVEGLCRRMSIPTPITLGIIDPRQNIRRQLETCFEKTASNTLIVKPIRGHAGLGIVLAFRAGERLMFRAGATEFDASSFLPAEKCLVQELLQQRKDISAVASHSINTLRLLSVLTPRDEFVVVGASMRFGRSDAFIDNWSAGGVAVGVDVATGRLMDVAFDKKGRGFRFHPDSLTTFGDFLIPDWQDVVAFGQKVHRAFPFFRLLGMDIAFTETGYILIEINNDADLDFQEQTSGPILASRENWQVFREYGLLYNRKQEQLYSSRA